MTTPTSNHPERVWRSRQWRTYRRPADAPENTLRFFALRLDDAGIVKVSRLAVPERGVQGAQRVGESSRWREYDPESTLRFYALRMREVGMVKKTPQQIIAQGTDWRFLNELRRELKG